MTAIGEESGALDEMLEKAATHYEEAVDNSVDNLTSLLEPLIIGAGCVSRWFVDCYVYAHIPAG